MKFRFGISQHLVILGIIAVVIANAAASFAAYQSPIDSFSINSDEEAWELKTEEEAEAAKLKEKQNEFLGRVRGELNLSKTDYRQLLNHVNDTKQQLDTVIEQKATLAGQIRVIDNVATQTSNRLINVIKQIIENENRIALLNEAIQTKKIAIDYQKKMLQDYIRVLYEAENSYFSFNGEGDVDALKLLLADGSVGENLRQLDYFSLLNESAAQMVEKLNRLNEELLFNQDQIAVRSEKLYVLEDELSKSKEQLDLQETSKKQLLKLTLGREKVYAQLLEDTLEQQAEVLNDIRNLNNAVHFINRKIEVDGEDFDPDQYASLLNYKNQALYDFHIDAQELGLDDFAWPVKPGLGISAYFRDPGYAGAFGVQHNAVDIPTYQGSPVRATADAVVYSVKDNGYGYSYIVLSHGGGFSTVYGHMSSILIEAGDFVTQGTIIGLSGGMPGTLGAGYMTTGPHLHFEMLLNGLYIDPLKYLPLQVLTGEQMEDLPEKYLLEWELATLDAGGLVAR